MNVALNRISGEFDVDMLANVLKDIEAAGGDMDLTGLTTTELDDLLGGFEVPDQGLTDSDFLPEPLDEPQTQRGDVIYLGRHRLMCGDSASREDVHALMGDLSVHLVHMDPPYNVAVEPRSNNAISAAGKGSTRRCPET